MLEKRGFFNYFWFEPHIKFGLFNIHLQSAKNRNVLGFCRKTFYTKVLSLKEDNSILLGKMDKGTQYDIRRSIKDGVECGIEKDIDKFITFYNAFSNSKGIGSITSEHIFKKHEIVILKSYLNEDVLTMHAYICDKAASRVRLLYSASNQEIEHIKEKKQLVGRANRYLHYFAISRFKDSGFFLYDFGGYALNTDNKALMGINSFKDSFGGDILEEYNYYPYIYLAALKVSALFKIKKND